MSVQKNDQIVIFLLTIALSAVVFLREIKHTLNITLNPEILNLLMRVICMCRDWHIFCSAVYCKP